MSKFLSDFDLWTCVLLVQFFLRKFLSVRTVPLTNTLEYSTPVFVDFVLNLNQFKHIWSFCSENFTYERHTQLWPNLDVPILIQIKVIKKVKICESQDNTINNARSQKNVEERMQVFCSNVEMFLEEGELNDHCNINVVDKRKTSWRTILDDLVDYIFMKPHVAFCREIDHKCDVI